MLQPQPTRGRAKMPQCALKYCENNHRNSKVSEGVSFFRFPSDPFRCAEWISIVAQERREESYNPCKNSTICSIHFDKFDISGNAQRRRLVNTAIPKLQINVEQKNVQAVTLTELTTPDLVVPSTNSKDTKTPAASISNSPAASLSDLIPLQDTPRKAYLKRQLIISHKIIEAKTKKIQNLQKVIKRLKKKNYSLKNIINLLQKKKSVDDTIFYIRCPKQK